MTSLDMTMNSLPLNEKLHGASYRERNGDGYQGEGKARYGKSSERSLSKLDRSPTHSRKIVYPPRLLVDFNSLHIDALNKYAAFYSIPVREEYTKDELAAIVARHFDGSLEVDEDDSIVSFVTCVRNGEKTTRSRPSAPKTTQASRKAAKEEPKPAATSTTSSKRNREEEDMNVNSNDKDDDTDVAPPPPPKKPSGKQGKKSSSNEKNDENELYCVCNLPGYGSMIACDGKQCPNPSQWYHLECVGFSDGQHPDTWFCPECDPKAFAAVLKKKKKNRNGGSSTNKDKSKDSRR